MFFKIYRQVEAALGDCHQPFKLTLLGGRGFDSRHLYHFIVEPFGRTLYNMGSLNKGFNMKTEEKKEARRLRKECGLSVRDIANRVGVSKGTISLWVRDIQLTNKQIRTLKDKNPAINRQMAGAKTRRDTALKERISAQQEGIKAAKEGNILHAQGCMLYWAEGYKRNNKNSISFANSDPAMVKLFVSFLVKCLNIRKDDMVLKIQCHTVSKTLKQVEDYWKNLTGIPQSSKTIINLTSKASKNKKGHTLDYGTCSIVTHNTRALQHIFGAIQEYGNFERPEWLG